MHHVVIHPSVVLLVQTLGVHELLQRNLGNTIDAGNQLVSIVICFCVTTAIGNDTMQTGQVLRAWAVDHLHDCHHDHRFRFRISESKELTCA